MQLSLGSALRVARPRFLVSRVAAYERKLVAPPAPSERTLQAHIVKTALAVKLRAPVIDGKFKLMVVPMAWWLCFASFLFLATSGCRTQSSRTIAVIPGTTATEFWEAAHGGAETAGRDTGFRIYWNGPTREDDVERQIALVERAIDDEYAGLVVAPTNYLALVGSVRQALSRHIPTVVIRSSLPIPPGQGLSYILNDDQETGRLAATRVGMLLAGKGKVAVLGLDASGPRSVLRARAIEAELAKSFPEVSIVEKRSGSSNTAEVQQIAQEILIDNPGLDVIIALDVTATEGTWAALAALGRGNRVKLVGCEQEVDLMAGIRHGDIDSVIVENTYEMGLRAVQSIAARRRGEWVPDRIELKPVLVTKANIDSAQVQRMLSVNWRVSH
jgi:ribose transport system substrate-binding protein